MTKNSTGGPWPHQVVQQFREADDGFALRGATELDFQLSFSIGQGMGCMFIVWLFIDAGDSTFIVHGHDVPKRVHGLVWRLTQAFADIAGEEMAGRREGKDSEFIAHAGVDGATFARDRQHRLGQKFARDREHGDIELEIDGRADKLYLGHEEFWAFAPKGPLVVKHGIENQLDGSRVPNGANRFWLRLFDAFVSIVAEEDDRAASRRSA